MTDICSSQTSINSSQTESSKFVIPKKTKSQEYSLNDLENDDSTEKEVLEERLKSSNFDLTNNLSAYKRTQIKRVENKVLEDEFTRLLNNRKAQIFETNKQLHNLKNKTCLIERVLFYVVGSEADMMDIVRNGFTCRPSDDDDLNVLGPAAYGLHMSKHLDITLMYQYYLKLKSFYIIVVKTFYSAFRLSAPVPEKNKKSYPDPSDGFEMSNQLPQKDQPIKVRYYNSLVYLFDSDDDLNIIETPRNVFPWAVLKYEESLSLPIEKEFINLYINPNLKDLKNQIKLKRQQQQKPKNLTKKNNMSKTITPVLKPPPQPFRFRPQNAVIVTSPATQVNINNKLIEPMIPSAQTVANFKPQSDQPIVPVLPKFDKPESHESQKAEKKLLSVFGSDGSESEPEEFFDDENWAEFCYQYYMDNFSDLIEEIHAKPPRWRVIYERTGKLGVKFKSEKQLCKKPKFKSDARFEVRLEDIRKTKLKFVDDFKSKVNLKDPTNNLILTYHLKRMKNHVSNTNLVKVESATSIKSEPKASILSKEQKLERHKKLAGYSQILAEIKKKADKNEPKSVKSQKTVPIGKNLNPEMTSLEKKLLNKPSDTQQRVDDRKNFWEPDKDSEFYLTRIRTEKCEPFTDVLILTRLSLNKKVTIEYSKQFYDSNAILFDAEMEKFVRLNKSIFPCDEWTKSKVESHIKVPLRPQIEPQTRREKFRQKFVHHIKTRNLVSPFQVDNLRTYAELRDRLEIHAGGFNGLVVDQTSSTNCAQAEPIVELSEECQSSKSTPLSQTIVKVEPSEVQLAKTPESSDQPIVSRPDTSSCDKGPKIFLSESRNDAEKTKKRLKHKKKVKHKKKKLKKILNSSSSDSSFSDSSPERYKKSKYSDLSESDSDEKHKHRHKHKHKHKRARSKIDAEYPTYDFPTYDFDLGESFVEHDIKTELDEFMIDCNRPSIDNDSMSKNDFNDAISSQSCLTLPIDKPVGSNEIDMEIETAECIRSGPVRSNENTPNMHQKPNKFHTPEYQRHNLRPQQFSSAPGFRFNKTIATNASVSVNHHQQQKSAQNGSANRNTSNPIIQPANTSSLKVYRFNPVKTIQSKQNADSSNSTTNMVCKQEVLR